ncbi:MAG: glycosyltransferase family protein [Bacteroidota bacterium]
MRVLYAIQGTGNGHLSRAIALLPHFHQHAEVDILVSGTQSELKLPYPISYQYRGASFHYNKRGGIHYAKSGWKNLSLRVLREIRQLPVDHYDLVVNDFEPISAWAAKLRKVPSVSVSHQASFLTAKTPRPEKQDAWAEFILRNYAPTSQALGFHFQPYDSFIFPPIIRPEIRKLEVQAGQHVTVYLPAYRDKQILRVLTKMPEVQWQVFSRYSPQPQRHGNVWIRPVSGSTFMESLAGAKAVLCSAGFETPSEALYLGKKLCVIPIKGQYEQLANAAALAKMGIPVLQKLAEKEIPTFQHWLACPAPTAQKYPQMEGLIVKALMDWAKAGRPDHLFPSSTFQHFYAPETELAPLAPLTST